MMIRSESIGAIAKAMADFQGEVKQPKKDADNPFFKSKYVPLDNVVDAINSCGPKHGLSFTQWPSVHPENGRIGITTMIMHSSGEWLEFDPLYMHSEKDTAQGAGSVITYARRYALSAAYGLASDEDDDGNTASGDPSKPSKTSNTPTPTNTHSPSSGTSTSQYNGSVAELVSPAQVKFVGFKAKEAQVSMQRISDFVKYPVTKPDDIHKSDVNKVIKMIEDAKSQLDNDLPH